MLERMATTAHLMETGDQGPWQRCRMASEWRIAVLSPSEFHAFAKRRSIQLLALASRWRSPADRQHPNTLRKLSGRCQCHGGMPSTAVPCARGLAHGS